MDQASFCCRARKDQTRTDSSLGLLIHIDDIRYQEGQAKCPKSEWVGAFKVVGPFFCCP
jgi:hypothetical protein